MSTMTPQENHPLSSEQGCAHPRTVHSSLPACGGRAHPPSCSIGSRSGAVAAGMTAVGSGSAAGTPRPVPRVGWRPAALRRAQLWAVGSGGSGVAEPQPALGCAAEHQAVRGAVQQQQQQSPLAAAKPYFTFVSRDPRSLSLSLACSRTLTVASAGPKAH